MPTAPPTHKPFPSLSPFKRPEHSVAANRFRNCAPWKRFAKLELQRRPLCEDCQERGVIAAATELHHCGVRLAERLQRGLSPYTDVRGLCHACHSARTRRGE